MKKIIQRISAIALCAVVILTSFAVPAFAKTEDTITFTPSFGINSESCILYSLDESKVIYKKNADKREMPAQLVNIMAAVIVLEKCQDPDSKMIIVDNSIYADKFYAYNQKYGYDDIRYAGIKNEDELTVTELLYAMMLTGSCEAAEVLASEFGSAGKDFVYLMNEKAKSLGCKNTNFANVTGLYDTNQYTTADDLLIITNYALKNEKFVEISTASSYQPTIRNTKNHADGSWLWSNSNTMMAPKSDYYYEGSKGIKTGNLDKGGRSLVMEYNDGSYSYLLILLNAPFEDGDGNLKYYHLTDAINLFDWISDNLTEKEILKKDEEIAEVSVGLSKDDTYVLVRPKDTVSTLWCSDIDISVIQRNIKLDDNVIAPVKKGQKLGTVELTYNGTTVAKEDLVAAKNVRRSFVKYGMFAVKNYPRSKFMFFSVIVALCFSLIYIFICIWSYVNVKKSTIPKRPVHLVPRVESSTSRKRPSNRTERNVYAQKEQRPVRRGKPVKMTDISYDDDDFKH